MGLVLLAFIDDIPDKIQWTLLLAVIGGVGWVGRSILKPWSDAAILWVQGFVSLVKVLESSIPAIHSELGFLKDTSVKSNAALGMNTLAANEQTEQSRKQTVQIERMIEAFGSDPMKMCKAEAMERMECKAASLGITKEKFEELLTLLRNQGKDSADREKAFAVALEQSKK